LPSNPDSLHVIQVQKRESAALGGDASDNHEFPSPIEPEEDGIECAAVFIVEAGSRNQAVALWRDGNNLRLRDVTHPNSGLTLADLLKVKASSDDSTANYLLDALSVDGLDKTLTGTPGTDRLVKLAISTTNPGPQLISIDPGSLHRSGSSGELTMDGFHASEFAKAVTAYGSHSRCWFRSPSTSVIVKVKFAIKSNAAAGNIVRLAARVKAQPTGGSTGAAWQSSTTADVSVSSGSAKAIYEGTLTLTPAVFTAGDAVGFEFGRDGSHANDTYNKSIRLIAIRVEVV
jgi:hypothetical protein